MALALADPRSTVQLAAPTGSTTLPPASLRLVCQPVEPLPWAIDGAHRAAGWLLQARHLVELHPDSATAYARLANAELIAGDESEALSAAQSALELTARVPDSSATLAALQVALACRAVELIESHAGRVDPGSLAEVLFAQAAIIRSDYKAAVERLASTTDSVGLAMRGWTQLQLHNYQAAVRDLRASLRLAGPSAELLANLGYAYGALGARKKAVSTTLQARVLAPTSETVVFNLVSYLVHEGQYDAALRELARFASVHPSDPRIALARADVLTSRGDIDGALKELRRTHGETRWKASPTARAEFAANIAFLEWKVGKTQRVAAIEAIRKELLRCDYKSLGIARMLASLFSKASEASQLETVYEGLAKEYPASRLRGIRCKIEFLKQNFSSALDAAESWLEEEPFNVDAATLLTYLLSDFANEFGRAADVGRVVLRRVPAAWMLANNIAYALAMDGRLEEAAEVLPRQVDSPFIIATDALIKFLSGDAESGTSGYQQAANLAKESGDSGLAALVGLRAYILLRDSNILPEKHDALDDDWAGDPRVELMHQQALKRGLAWPLK
jgi:Flp pilus assembly protein TadD